MSAAERRLEIIDILCEKRGSTTKRLADYFGVSQRTIINDVEQLSLYYPIYTTYGRNGGIFLTENYNPKKKYLNDEQTNLLKEVIAKHAGKEEELLKYILKTYGVKRYVG